MTTSIRDEVEIIESLDISHIITEDDEPVDNIFSAKQQRLLVEPLYSSWQPQRAFLADSNIGIFRALRQPPIVPDMFLSMDVQVADDWFAQENRSYFLWEYGKPPELVVEIVSNKKGEELTRKLYDYAHISAGYYVIYDPQLLLQDTPVTVRGLYASSYILRQDTKLPNLDLSLMLWEGQFEGLSRQWLRWCDSAGNLIPTGAERAEQERQRAEQERQRADRLAAQLRALGVDPTEF